MALWKIECQSENGVIKGTQYFKMRKEALSWFDAHETQLSFGKGGFFTIRVYSESGEFIGWLQENP